MKKHKESTHTSRSSIEDRTAATTDLDLESGIEPRCPDPVNCNPLAPPPPATAASEPAAA